MTTQTNARALANGLDQLAYALETTGVTVHQSHGLLLDLQSPIAHACALGCIGLHVLGRAAFGSNPGSWRAVEIELACPVLNESADMLVTTGAVPAHVTNRFAYHVYTIKHLIVSLNDNYRWTFPQIAAMLRTAAAYWHQQVEAEDRG